mmetsp:Transcript_29033/g.70119  ORF Transcript_29033/g.70119 Transcript_29033/m.70119 type:complete len:127 (-) Transcript_29033:405-785(-)
MCSPPPLQDYFTKLLKERNVTISSLKVQIVDDNAQLSKQSHARASQRQSRSMINKNFKTCRWSSSTTLIRKGLEGPTHSNSITARDMRSMAASIFHEERPTSPNAPMPPIRTGSFSSRSKGHSTLD